MITLKYTAIDKGAAQRIAEDLQSAGMEITTELQQGKDQVFILVLSQQAEKDADIKQAILFALDHGQFIVPVLVQKMALPSIIEHLTPVDFSQRDSSSIIERIQAFGENKQHVAMRVHTPRTQAANRRMAYLLVFLALFICGASVLLVGGGVVEFPVDEYNAVDTAEASTISAEIGLFIEPNLPRSTDEAAQFSSTLQAAPTRYQPFLAATATAIASTPQP